MDGNGDLPAQAVLLLGSGAAVKVAVGVDRAGKFIFGVSKNRGRADIDGVAFAEVGFRLFARLGGLFEDHRQDIAHAVSPPVGGERPVVAGFKHAPGTPSSPEAALRWLVAQSMRRLF